MKICTLVCSGTIDDSILNTCKTSLFQGYIEILIVYDVNTLYLYVKLVVLSVR